MRQSMGAMIAKIAVGALFIVSPLTTGEASTIVTGLIIGLALIAWGLLPYIKAKRTKRENVDAQFEKMQTEANAAKVCKACGATTKGLYCEYCGSRLD